MKDLVPSLTPPFLPAWSSSLAVCLVAFVGLGLVAPAVVASPIAYQFSGVIDAADPSTGVASGTPFSGTFSYDPGSPPQVLDFPWLSEYAFGWWQNGHMVPDKSSLTMSVGGKTVVDVSHLLVAVTDSTNSPGTYVGVTPSTQVNVGGYDSQRLGIGLRFTNPSSSIDPTLALPTSFSLGDYPQVIVTVRSDAPGTLAPLYTGTITTLTPVPEPSALALPALVAIGLGARRYWRRRGGRSVQGNSRSASA